MRRIFSTYRAIGALLLSLMAVSASAENLPDGALGKPGLQLTISRTTTTFDASNSAGTNGPDWTNAELSLPFPISRKIAFTPRYRAENRVNILHELTTDFTVRGATPGQSWRVNADGTIGKPVVSVRLGLRFYEMHTEDVFGTGGFEIQVPSSTHLTIGAGGYFTSDTSVTFVENYFGLINWYTAKYLDDEPFHNPDGPVGFVAARLRAGGASGGIFGELRLLFPINPRATVSGFIRGQRVTEPYERWITFGASYSIYPGVSR